MLIENGYQYLNFFESKRRLIELLEIAEMRLTPIEFAGLRGQVESELLEIDSAIGAYQQKLISEHASQQFTMWAGTAFFRYCVKGNRFSSNSNSVYWCSPSRASTIVGLPGSDRNQQLVLGFQL